MTTHQHVGVMLVQAALQTGQQVRARVTGTSMRPLLDVGDHVWVEPVSLAALRPGDVVTVWHAGSLLTHRVLNTNADGCVTKGDNCAAADQPVAADRIMGRVVVVERGDRWIEIDRRRWRLVGGWVARLSVAEAALVRQPRRTVRASSVVVRAAMRGVLGLFIRLED